LGINGIKKSLSALKYDGLLWPPRSVGAHHGTATARRGYIVFLR